jgi:cytochrome c5
MSLKYMAVVCALLVSIPAFAQGPLAKGSASAQACAKVSRTQPVVRQGGSEGEQIFQQQCSRCHNAPQGFSPRISATVVRHMRIRASLSKHDEQELLRFFNP